MQPVAASRLLHAPVLLCDCSLTPTSGKALAELPATEALMERLASRSSACPARAASVVRKAGMPGRLPSRPATGSGGVPPLPSGPPPTSRSYFCLRQSVRHTFRAARSRYDSESRCAASDTEADARLASAFFFAASAAAHAAIQLKDVRGLAVVN